jgi:hypothetical protein
MIIHKNIRNLIGISGTSIIVLASTLMSTLPASAASTTALLSLSPTSQTLNSSSEVTLTVDLNTDGNSINTVQTVLSYPSANFSLVKATAGSSFGSFIDTPKTGSLIILAATTSPVSSTSPVTVATVTLKAKESAAASFALAPICSGSKSSISCSAVYDSTTNANDLAKVASPAVATIKLSGKSVKVTHHFSYYLLYGLLLLIILMGFIFFGSRIHTHKKRK